jgi:hypothetical protein
MTSTNPFAGTDLAWLAQDRAGHVGIFTVNDQGAVPAPLHDTDLDAHETILAAWIRARGLERRPGPDPEAVHPLDAADAGLFVYDASRETCHYELEVRPERPILHADLPEELRASSHVRLPVDFASADVIEAATVTGVGL